jgi:hypothetical protein
VSEFSSRSVSAGSQLSAPGACVGMCRWPTVCSDAACGVVRVRDVYTGRADGLRCVELLPSQVGGGVLP